MSKIWNRILFLLLAAVLILSCSLGIFSGRAKYTQKIDFEKISLNVEATKVIVTDLFYNGSGFYADPACTIPVAIETDEQGKKVLVASKSGSTITRMSQFNGVETNKCNIWIKDTYTTFGNETLSGDYTIRRYTGFTGTMISVVNGSPTINVTIDGGDSGVAAATYWDDAEKKTVTATVEAMNANAPAVSVNGGNLTLSGTVQNNTNSSGDGGGILVTSGSLNCTNTAKVTGNHAAGNGGGICYEYGKANVGNLLNNYTSFVTGNSADGKGPQIYPSDKEVFAVLDTNGVLHFYDRIGVPKPGDTFDGVTVSEVYTDFINTGNVPWSDDADSVKRVEVEDVISPTTAAGWFSDMDNVTSIDLKNLNTSSTTNFSNMFSRSSNLETIIVGDSWKVDGSDTTANMFSGCSSLIGGAGSTGLTDKDGAAARVDGGTAHPGYLTYAGYALVFEPNYSPFDGDPADYPDVQTSTTSGTFNVNTSSFQPARDGYTFLGWSADLTATAAEFAAGATVSYTVTGETPVCGKLYAVWGEVKAQTIELYMLQTINRSTIYYNLYNHSNATASDLVNLSVIDQSLVFSTLNSDDNGHNYKFRPDNTGKVLSAYAEYYTKQYGPTNFIVNFDGYYQEDGGDHSPYELILVYTGPGSMTIKFYDSGNPGAKLDKYWINSHINYTEIANVTLDGNGVKIEEAPIWTKTDLKLENVTFVNFFSGSGARNCYDIVKAFHPGQAGLYTYEYALKNVTANNVRFLNCTASGSGFVNEDLANGCDHYIHGSKIEGEVEDNSSIIYTLNTAGSTGLTFESKEELPATEHAQIQISPDENMGLPSEFPVKVNDKEYIVRPYGFSDNGTSVILNSDGTYTLTVPSHILRTEAYKDGTDNVIYLDVDAITVYFVSKGTLENVTLSYGRVAPPDADYTFNLHPSYKHSLTDVTITINDVDIAREQFAANGITISDSSYPVVTISKQTLKDRLIQDDENTIVISAKAVTTPKYTIKKGVITGATMPDYPQVAPDEVEFTDIVLTVNDDSPVMEYIIVKVNDAEYRLEGLGESGVHVKRSGHTYTITVPSSVMMQHLKEKDNVITIDAYARPPQTTISHTSVTLPAKEIYTGNWVVEYKDQGNNDDGSYSTFIKLEDGFILDRYWPVQVGITVEGVTYFYPLSGEAQTGDVSFDPETGEVKVSAEFLSMFPDKDIAIDVAVRSVLRQVNVTTASNLENLTVSNTWMDIDEGEILLLNLTTTGGLDNQWVKEIEVTVSDTHGNSKPYTITRTESMDDYPHMTIFWLQDREEQIIFRGDELIKLLHEWNGTPTKWTTDDLTITFTSITYETRPETAEPVAFALVEPDEPRYYTTARVCRLDEAPPQPDPTEPHKIAVYYDLTDLDYKASGDYAVAQRDYSVIVAPDDGYMLPEIICVDIDGTEYEVYTDGRSNTEGSPTFDSDFGRLTIPAVLLTDETRVIEITASALAIGEDVQCSCEVKCSEQNEVCPVCRENVDNCKGAVSKDTESETDATEISSEKGETDATDATEESSEKEETGATDSTEATSEKGENGATDSTEASSEKEETDATGSTEATSEKGETDVTDSTEATSEKGETDVTDSTEATSEKGETDVTDSTEVTSEKGETGATDSTEATSEKGETDATDATEAPASIEASETLPVSESESQASAESMTTESDVTDPPEMEDSAVSDSVIESE